MNRNRTRWSVIIFAIFMSLIMVGSLATGWLMNIAQQREFRRQQQAAAEPTPLPTFEPPPATDSLTFDTTALQGNAVFTVALPGPIEWGAVESSFDNFANRARLLMRNNRYVIESTAETPTEPVTTVADVDAYFNAQRLGSSWANYRTWEETARSTLTTDAGQEVVQMDFELEFGGRTFVARQRAWTDGERIYTVRVVTPENATELLVTMLENVADSYEVVERYADIPLSWNAYYDESLAHVIRYPANWQVTDSAPGAPASIESQDIALRVEAVEETEVTSDEAAEAYAAQQPYVTEVLTVTEVEREGLEGYAVSYRTRDLDGETGSGLVTLLNGDGVLHVADLRVGAIEADLNAIDEEAENTAVLNDYALVAETFSPFSGVTYAANTSTSAAPLNQNANAGANINPAALGLN